MYSGKKTAAVAFAIAAAALMMAAPCASFVEDSEATSVTKGEAGLSYEISGFSAADMSKLYRSDMFIKSWISMWIVYSGINLEKYFTMDESSITVKDGKMNGAQFQQVLDADKYIKTSTSMRMIVSYTFDVSDVGMPVMTTDDPAAEVFGVEDLKSYLPEKTSAGDKIKITSSFDIDIYTQTKYSFEMNGEGAVIKYSGVNEGREYAISSKVAYLVGGSDTDKKEFTVDTGRFIKIERNHTYDYGNTSFNDVRADSYVSDREVYNYSLEAKCTWSADGKSGAVKRSNYQDTEDIMSDVTKATTAGHVESFVPGKDIKTEDIHFYPTDSSDKTAVFSTSFKTLFASGITGEETLKNVLNEIGKTSTEPSKANLIFNDARNAASNAGKNDSLMYILLGVLGALVVGTAVCFAVRKRRA